ncbi:MAG: ChuX/HutX family heme-like substrate-binding protein [Bacteroidota bacterium]
MKKIDLLKKEMAKLKAEEPKLRNRDLAQRLGISEVELLSLSAGENVTILNGDWKNLLKAFHKLDYVMALTRNDHCVHERKGVYDNIEFYKGVLNMGVAVNPDIDLRFFMNEWHYGLAVTMPRGKNGTLYSFQFFNKCGEAVHKIYSTSKTNMDAYHLLVELYKSNKQQPLINVEKQLPKVVTELPDEEIDVLGFRQSWIDLQDTHDFYGMLRKYNVTRLQGLRLAPAGMAEEVEAQSVVSMLEKAAEHKLPIMCFVHSKGCVQIHTGPVKNLKFYGDWYNVLDPKFNLHLKMSSIDQAWIVRKPTIDGIVTSLELFDSNGQLIVYFFGARKPGKPELDGWRKVIDEISLVKVTS